MKFFNVFKIVLVFGFVLLATGCQIKGTPLNNNSSSQLTVQDNQIVTAAAKTTTDNLKKAKILAAGWKNDAILAGFNLKMPADMSTNGITQTFIFGSQQDQDYWWTVSIDEAGKYVRAIIPKDDYLGKNLSPVQEDYWKKNYIEALNTAEQNGGISFRAQNPEAEVYLVLQQSQPKGWLWWVVNYKGAKNNLTIRISAADGKVYDDQGNLKTTTNNAPSAPQDNLPKEPNIK